MIADGVLLLLCGALFAAGLLLAWARDVVRAGFLLFALLFEVAGIYAVTGAPVLAVSQVIVYVGGILILLMFGVMLTQKARDLNPQTGWHNLVPGLLAAGGLFAGLVLLMRQLPVAGAAAPAKPQLQQLGDDILLSWILPFEMITVLLLAALAGAAWLVRPRHDSAQEGT